jgi:acyl-CoA thioesterase I
LLKCLYNSTKAEVFFRLICNNKNKHLKKKILIIGDSLSLPGHSNNYEDTWVYKVKNYFKDFDFITHLQRSLTTNVLVSQGGGGPDDFPRGSDVLEYYMPDIVIIQLGIVDCAPRLFNKDKLIVKIIDRLPKLIKTIIYNTKLRITGRLVENSYVSLSFFKKNLINYLDRAKQNKTRKIIFISICYPDERMRSKNPNIYDQVDLYNNVILNVSKLFDDILVINPLDSRIHNDVIYEDGYHPNSYGNEIVYSELKKSLKNI